MGLSFFYKAEIICISSKQKSVSYYRTSQTLRLESIVNSLLRDWKCPQIITLWWLQTLNIPKTTERYSFNRWILWYVKCISIKLLKIIDSNTSVITYWSNSIVLLPSLRQLNNPWAGLLRNALIWHWKYMLPAFQFFYLQVLGNFYFLFFTS